MVSENEESVPEAGLCIGLDVDNEVNLNDTNIDFNLPVLSNDIIFVSTPNDLPSLNESEDKSTTNQAASVSIDSDIGLLENSGLLDQLENNKDEKPNTIEQSQECVNIFEEQPLENLDGPPASDVEDRTQSDEHSDEVGSSAEDPSLLEEDPKPKLRKKRHQVKPNDWKFNKSKIARKLGKEYVGKKGKRMESGSMTYLRRREK